MESRRETQASLHQERMVDPRDWPLIVAMVIAFVVAHPLFAVAFG